MLQNIDTAAPSDTCSQCVNDWDRSSLESIALASKFTQSGSLSKMTLLPSGDLETEVPGVLGYEVTNSSFHEKGWE